MTEIETTYDWVKQTRAEGDEWRYAAVTPHGVELLVWQYSTGFWGCAVDDVTYPENGGVLGSAENAIRMAEDIGGKAEFKAGVKARVARPPTRTVKLIKKDK